MKHLAVLLSLLAAAPAVAATPRVVDGDTLVLDGTRWRLCGIDAPEHDAPGGSEATAYLHKLVDGRDVTCSLACNRTDRYGRSVGFCSVAGKDLGRLMIDAGHACRWARYDNGVYRGAEECKRR
ncbi:Endonuclease YncB, thermonuclease family [Arboricoccus pini]|uniref:Endonuclease YncB, thermonuclease family n=1 Tax=Arboricoccus pini TaxID=1963835 RepID=A0A212R6J5_9PROT|nr:Endonuclease YncB, thermonuclease family [Arboricoccus pini]